MDKKILSRLMYGAVLLLTAACSQEETADDTQLPERKYPLEIASVAMDVESSRQPWGANAPQARVSESSDGNSSVWQTGDVIGLGIEGYEEIGKYRMTVADNNGTVTVTPATPVYWKDKEAKKVRAWYPANGSIDLSNQTPSTGLAYALYAETAETVDYQTSSISLPFVHKLAKVRVVFDGDTNNEVKDVKVKTLTSCTIHADGTLTNGDKEENIPMMSATYNGQKCWEANVVPNQQITKLLVNNRECTLDNNGLTPLMAKVNTITLKVKPSLLPTDGKFIINEDDDVIIRKNQWNKQIIVNGNATITLDNVILNVSGTEAAITINNGAQVTLNIKGSNYITSTNGSGIKIMQSQDTDKRGSIIINGTGYNPELDVTAGSGAAIGFRMTGHADYRNNYCCGDIEINGVSLTAKGGDKSPAIGISSVEDDNQDYARTFGNITITNSTVTVTSTGGAACIGTPKHNSTSPFSLGTISITNSTIKANAGNDNDGNKPACIGFGYTAKTGGTPKRVIEKIEFSDATLRLTTNATYQVGFGDGDESRTLTDGIWNNGTKVADTEWNPQ